MEPRKKLEPNIQNLSGGHWTVERTFKDFASFRSHVYGRIERGEAVETLTIFRNYDGSGCVELFFPGRIIGQCPFISSLEMEKKIRGWEKLGRPSVVVFCELERGAYERQDPKTWRW